MTFKQKYLNIMWTIIKQSELSIGFNTQSSMQLLYMTIVWVIVSDHVTKIYDIVDKADVPLVTMNPVAGVLYNRDLLNNAHLVRRCFKGELNSCYVISKFTKHRLQAS